MEYRIDQIENMQKADFTLNFRNISVNIFSTDGWTDGLTDGRMDRRMDGRKKTSGEGHYDQFWPKIIQIGAILGDFWLLSVSPKALPTYGRMRLLQKQIWVWFLNYFDSFRF